jgi:hypothetical protein
MKTSRTWMVGLFLAAAFCGARNAEARPARAEVVRALMVPTTAFDAQLVKRAVPEASSMLCGIASDESVHVYARKRAIAALTSTGGPEAFECIRRLATDTTLVPVLRRYALYALGRRYAAERTDLVMPILRAALRSKDVADREKAVRAMAYANPACALAALESHVPKETSATVKRLAQARIERLRKAQRKHR